MIEREKQKADQKAKMDRKAEHAEAKKEHGKEKPEQKHARMSTDPAAMQDKGYVDRIEEKTEKH